ncbi:flavodoxin [Clostridium sp. AN503]|uniref:flavodoxin n=1 Tax=Clostridium sp. AN503 TaxID=3160598 RepID=UPI003458653A
MKHISKIVVLITAACITLGATACQNAKALAGEGPSAQQTQAASANAVEPSWAAQATAVPETTQPISTEPAKKDTLVAYFSATGTTKSIAEKIAALTGADQYEILPAEHYSKADLNYSDSQSRATSEMNDPDSRPQISSDPLSLEGYTTLYLGYPIWWGDAPRIMSTFVETHDFNGITIIPFCTSGGSGIGQSSDHLAKQAGSGTWLPGQRFSGSTSDDEITSWLAEHQ